MREIFEQKRVILQALLELCPFVHVLGDRADVEGLPSGLRRPDLVLRLGQNPNVMAIPDLVINEVGFSCTLSLRPARYSVLVPWAAVGRYWIGDPFEGPVVAWAPPAQAPAAEIAPVPTRPGLRIVKDGG
jgi:hypothetical protein